MIADWLNVRDLLIFALVFIPLERLIPFQAQPINRRGILTDLLHFFVSGALVKFGLSLVIMATLAAAGAVIPSGLSGAVGALPLLVAVPLAIVLSDLGFYLSHRLLHTVPFLWRFHAIHHSSERLDWLAAYRVHPVDMLLVKTCSLVPLFALGFSELAILIAVLIYHWHSILLHSNVHAPFGPLKWIIASPAFHHWHHAHHDEAIDKNFAGQLSFWDVVFGTAHMPGYKPQAYGIDAPVPDGYLDQLAQPFRVRDEPSLDKALSDQSVRT